MALIDTYVSSLPRLLCSQSMSRHCCFVSASRRGFREERRLEKRGNDEEGGREKVGDGRAGGFGGEHLESLNLKTLNSRGGLCNQTKNPMGLSEGAPRAVGCSALPVPRTWIGTMPAAPLSRRGAVGPAAVHALPCRGPPHASGGKLSLKGRVEKEGRSCAQQGLDVYRLDDTFCLRTITISKCTKKENMHVTRPCPRRAFRRHVARH